MVELARKFYFEQYFNPNMPVDKDRFVGNALAQLIASSRYRRYRNPEDTQEAMGKLSPYIHRRRLVEFVVQIQNYPRDTEKAVSLLLDQI